MKQNPTSKWTKVAPNLWQNGKRHIESLGGGYYELSVDGVRFKTIKADLATVKRDWMWQGVSGAAISRPEPDEFHAPLPWRMESKGVWRYGNRSIEYVGRGWYELFVDGVRIKTVKDFLSTVALDPIWEKYKSGADVKKHHRELKARLKKGGISNAEAESIRDALGHAPDDPTAYSPNPVGTGLNLLNAEERRLRKPNPIGNAFKVGERQASALQIYVFDPAFDDSPAFEGDYDRFPGSWDNATSTLRIEPGMEQAAARRLTAAANSADDDKDNELRDALTSLAARITKTKKIKPRKVSKGSAKAAYEAAQADWQAARARLGEGTVESREAMQAAHRRLYEASLAYKGDRKDNPADAYKVLFKHVEAWVDTASHNDVSPSFLLYSQDYVWQLFVGPCCLEDRVEEFPRFSLHEYTGSPDEVEVGLKKARGLTLVGKVNLIPSSKQLAEWYGGWANSGFDQIYEGEDVVDLENALEADMHKKGLEASLDKDDRKMGLR